MSPKRKEVERFGRRGKVSVRVVREETASGAYHRVLWIQQGRRRTESYPDTRAGKAAAVAFAEGVYAELLRGPVAVAAALPARTLREVWMAYGVANFDALREASVVTLTGRWRTFETWAGRDTAADAITRERLDEYVKALRALKRAPNQIKLYVQTVRLVFRWAVDRDLIRPTKVTTYAFRESKADKRSGPVMREFRMEERSRVVAQFDPRSARQWRPWVFTVLAAQTGQRQNAIRHLAWNDLDFAAHDGAGVIRWNPTYQKTGVEHVQSMPADVRDALWVAYGWRCARAYRGPWVLFSGTWRTRGEPDPDAPTGRDEAARRTARRARASGDAPRADQPWTYQAYMKHLDAACKAAGVARAPRQGAHAFRRGVAGDITAAMGLEAAANWIGDRDLTVVRRHYNLTREDQQRAIAEGLPRLTTKDDGEGSE